MGVTLQGSSFNNPSNLITGVRLAGDSANLKLLGAKNFNNSINAQPYGYFDIAAALGGSLQGGGKPQYVIPVSDGKNFRLTLAQRRAPSLYAWQRLGAYKMMIMDYEYNPSSLLSHFVV